jgi:hypothetical protein
MFAKYFLSSNWKLAFKRHNFNFLCRDFQTVFFNSVSKGPHRVGATPSHPFLPQDGSRVSFRNVVFLKKKNIGRWIKTKSKILPKDSYSSLCVQTSSEAHPSSCPMGKEVPLPG